ncbi:GTPase IMAP family member 7-like [Alosa alosa]|uniref:GTPase IMAP family member 7-like n=1 Tax=Alosa alosa TaxID=278164 RepID=UPI0020152469|nr:GTPase IMAP family member 7-like [Alosa alosa]
MDEWRFMLLWRRGVGKSSSGNTILGQQVFPVNKTLSRVTQVCDRREGTVDGRPVAVIDTPGLKNSFGDEKKVIRKILKNTLEGTAPSDAISSADQELRDLIRECTGGFVVFDNKDMANRTQVTLLKEKIDTLMALNVNKWYPREYYTWSEKKIRKRHEKHMEEISEDIAEKEREMKTLYNDDELEDTGALAEGRRGAEVFC